MKNSGASSEPAQNFSSRPPGSKTGTAASFQLYYYENMQLFKIAAIFGVTESRICQILGQAVTPLRDYLTELLA